MRSISFPTAFFLGLICILIWTGCSRNSDTQKGGLKERITRKVKTDLPYPDSYHLPDFGTLDSFTVYDHTLDSLVEVENKHGRKLKRLYQEGKTSDTAQVNELTQTIVEAKAEQMRTMRAQKGIKQLHHWTVIHDFKALDEAGQDTMDYSYLVHVDTNLQVMRTHRITMLNQQMGEMTNPNAMLPPEEDLVDSDSLLQQMDPHSRKAEPAEAEKPLP